MSTILDTIVLRTKERVAIAEQRLPREALMKMVNELGDRGNVFPMEKALRDNGFAFICEVKKASPSKGVIDPEYDYIKIAKEYEESGAAAISVLTEPDYFLGADRHLAEIRHEVKIPILRKDFTVDTYQIYESKLLGAQCILLICSVLSTEQLKEFLEIAHRIGLSALVETHDCHEIQSALKAGARIIGVNNRNLKTMEVDLETSRNLRPCVPDDILFLSESGIRSKEDIRQLKSIRANGVLIGEAFMRSGNKGDTLKQFMTEGASDES